ncbi:ankyrin repeat domain-containing protein [bacterium]|nr:MAG: ankyrin repeat domain-containing protein [bacterium]
MNKKFIPLFLVAIALTAQALPAAYTPERQLGMLHVLAKLGHTQSLERFLPHCTIHIDTKQHGYTALHFAASNGHVEFLRKLIAYGADIEAKNDQFGTTPLLLAVALNQPACVQELLKLGANDAAIAEELCPLQMAIQAGNSDCMKILINHNPAIIHKKDNLGLTPLHYAATSGTLACVEVLIEHAADVHARTNNGKTALDLVRTIGLTKIMMAQLSEEVTRDDLIETNNCLMIYEYLKNKMAEQSHE